MGAFSLDDKVLSQIASSHGGKKIATVVDYDHSSVFHGSSRAAGWVEALDHRGNELHAAIRWTPAARDAIAAGEYKYLSPTITLKTKDRVTGEAGPPALHSVALTNVPFLHELPSVQLNNLLIEEEDDMEFKQLVCSQLGLASDASEDQIKSALIALRDPANSPEAVLALRNELNAMKAEAAKNLALQAVERAFSDGKLIEAQRDWAVEYASSLPDGFAKWAASAPVQVPLQKVERSPEVAKKADSGVVALSDEQRKINQILGVSDEEFAKFNKEE